MLLAVDLDEDFVDIEVVAVSSVLSLQPLCIQGAKFDSPESDRFPSDDNASFCEKVFDIAVAQIETIVEPNSVGNALWWKSAAFVGVHAPILVQLTDLTCQYQLRDYQAYYNEHQCHSIQGGSTPVESNSGNVIYIRSYRWKKHCRGLFQLPVAA
jgi:hypothetical protein